MKVGIYNPHLATLGGGENSMAVLADILANHLQAEVDLIAHDFEAVGTAELTERFGVDLTRVKTRFVPRSQTRAPWGRVTGLLSHNLELSRISGEYDLFISHAISGYVPSRAHRSFYLSMFPMTPSYRWPGIGRTLYFKWALSTYTRVAANSEFTRAWTRRYWNVEPALLYPPIAVSASLDLTRKQPMIVSVGRFFAGRHNKKHRCMIESFIQLVDQGFTGWEYHLVGGLTGGPGTREYVEELQAIAHGYPIYFHFDASAAELADLWARSRIFWHATGFGEDASASPEKMEHFGMSTVEAMNAGVVPVVIGQGGQPEIVTHGHDGYLWQTLDELRTHTRELAGDEATLDRLASSAHQRSLDFSRDAFAASVDALVRELMLDA